MKPKVDKKYHRADWVRRMIQSLRSVGYFYDPNFSKEVEKVDPILTAAFALGSLFVPSGTDPSRPVLTTRPSPRAPNWRPFDQREPIGWHNDFSTRMQRPELSLSWILNEDPSGSDFGAWRVASAQAVLSQIEASVSGSRIIRRLSEEPQPFGYLDAGSPRYFRVVSPEGLRFYGPALEDGARLTHGQVPDFTREAVDIIEKAADAVAKVLPSPTGAMLVVHNRFSLHDRTQQTVSGGRPRRRACLCFVDAPHEAMSGGWTATGDVQEERRLLSS